MNTRIILSSLLVLPLLVSCVKQGDLDSLSARMSRNEQQMQHLSAQVGNVEQVLPGQAEMWAQMQAMRQELNMVRGQLDEMTSGPGGAARTQTLYLEARVGRLEKAVGQMAATLGVKVEALDEPLDLGAMNGATPGEGAGTTPATTAGGAAGSATAAGGGAAANTAQTGTTQQDTATRLYDVGMNAFASRNYREAVRSFADFSKTFPKHKLASNAQFWLGESYFQLKDFGGAALAYNEVIEKFPGSNKYQSALLKQGMSFYYAGKKDAAKVRLNELVKKYPKSPEAGRAKKFMQENK